MKHLVNGAAVVAALVVAVPVWAQNPSGGNSMGAPGPNPGGPGLTPYNGAAAPAPPPAAMPAPPAAASDAPPPATSAAPPVHHPVRHARAMHGIHKHMARKAAAAGDTTAQLNREELARIQSGNMSNPSAPAPAPMPMPGSEESGGGRMPGPKTSGASGAGAR